MWSLIGSTILKKLNPFLPYLLCIGIGAGGMYFWMSDRVQDAKDQYSLLQNSYRTLNELRKTELESLASRNKESSRQAEEAITRRLIQANKEIKDVRKRLEESAVACDDIGSIHSLLDSASGVSPTDSRIP